MAFPRESEDQHRRNALNICQDYIRQVLTCVRELTVLSSSFHTQESLEKVEDRLLAIRRSKDNGREYKRKLMQELAEGGMLLIGREDILRLAAELEEISRYSESAGVMISYVTERKVEIHEDLRKGVFDLTRNALKTVTGLREAIMALMYTRSGPLEVGKNVEAAEFAVNEIYRDLILRILDSDLDSRAVLVLRDIIDLIENIADSAVNALDQTMILALTF